MIWLILSFVIISCKNEQAKLGPKKNDWQENNLVGKVKSVTEFSLPDTTDPFIVKKYNHPYGNITREFFNPKGFLISRQVVRNSIDSTFCYYTDLCLEPSVLYVYLHDSVNNKIEESAFRPNGIQLLRQLYFYDKTGNKIREQKFSGRDTFQNACCFKYNSKNQKIEEKYCECDSAFCHYYTAYIYDASGKLTEDDTFTCKGELTCRHVKIYKNSGRVIEEKYGYHGKEPILYWSTTYDKKGNEIELKFHIPCESDPCNLTTYKYEFDKTGNWVKQFTYENGKHISTSKRQIEYY